MKLFLFLLAGLAAAGTSFFISPPAGLTPQGTVLLGITAGMLVIWVTQAVDFSASAFFLLFLIALLCGLTEHPSQPGTVLGGLGGVALAVRGFTSPAWILVLSALFLAAFVDASGLAKRAGILLLLAIGTGARQIRIGALALTFVLTLFIPSPAAAGGLAAVILLGVLKLFGVPLRSNLTKGVLISIGIGPLFASTTILTGGGGPLQIASFIHLATGHEISWMEFAVWGFPLALGLYIFLFLMLERELPLEPMPQGSDKSKLRAALACCGPVSQQEKLVMAVLACTIPLWATGKLLHPLNNSTIAIGAVAVLFAAGAWPGQKQISFEQMASKVSWGTLMLFAAVLSLGQALLESGAASWLAGATLIRLGLASWPVWAIVLVGGAVYALFAVAFSARSAAIGALAPTILGFTTSLPPESGVSAWGLALILCYPVQFTIILPANSPMAMVVYEFGSFSMKEMLRVAFPTMLAGLGLLTLLSQTWWRWLGL